MERTLSIQPTFLPKPLHLSMILFATISALVIGCYILGAANDYPFTMLVFILNQPLAAWVGGLIIARQPRNFVGWCVVVHCFCFTMPEFARQYALYGGVTNPGSLPFVPQVAWFAYWLWGPAILFGLILLPLYFPNGKLVSPGWRYLVWFAVITSTFVTMMMAFSPTDIETPGLPNPYGFLPVAYADTEFATLAQGTWLISMALAVASLFVRFRRANSQEKQQIKWIFYAMILLATILFTPGGGFLSEVAGSLALAALWVAIGIAVLRYRLYDIDIIISRTLVYVVLTAVIVAAYLLTAGLLGAFIPSGTNLFNALIAAGLVALIFQPLRERLQRSVNRMLYGERDEPAVLLTRLGRRLEETLAPDQALPTIVETVATALKLPYAAIALGMGEEQYLAAEYTRVPRSETAGEVAGESAGESAAAESSSTVLSKFVTIPLVYQRQPLGEMRLGLRPGEYAFGPADWRVLNELARQVGVAVSSVQLTHDLQHAREALIVAREEERRRLRRDLHDGLGPVLAAQRLKLGSARHFLQVNPTLADRLLSEQERDLEGAIQEVRRLIDNLRPPVLDDLGLPVALRRVVAQYGAIGEGDRQGGAASQISPNGLRIAIEVPDTLPPLPAAVEVACYRIVQEALANVVRHADARHCRVTLALEARSGAVHGEKVLLLTICDDGRGLGQGGGNGIGLHSMRARAEELGGSMSIGPNRPTGTRLRVQLPVAEVQSTPSEPIGLPFLGSY